jgi:nitrite reductase/ring-hydroxylating ferredoxin subunit
MAQASGPDLDRLNARTLLAEGWVRSARSVEVGRTVLVWQLTPSGQQSGSTQTVLLWRTRRGKAVAQDARCPHRQYLMEDARLVRDSIECPLHGYRFGPDGRCVNFRWPAAARLIQVCEADGYLWLAP